MKMLNLRVDTPIIRGKYETSVNLDFKEFMESLVTDIAAKYHGDRDGEVKLSTSIRVKSVTFRALDTVGEQPVEAFNRKLFAIFKSNLMTAQINSEGHPAALGYQATATGTKAGPDTQVTSDVPYNYDIVGQMPAGIVAVITYEMYE